MNHSTSWKISILLSLLILGAGGWVGWNDHVELMTLRQDSLKRGAELQKLKPDEESLGTKEGARSGRIDRRNDVSLSVSEIVAFGKEVDACNNDPRAAGALFAEQGAELIGRMKLLDAERLQAVINEIRSSDGLVDGIKQWFIGSGIQMLSSDHPDSALKVFLECGDLFDSGNLGEQVVATLLGNKAKQDPFTALDWSGKISADHPSLIGEGTKGELVKGAADHDPALAFRLLSELDVKEVTTLVSDMGAKVFTDDRRDALLVALRNHLGSLSDEAKKAEIMSAALGSMTARLARDDFQKASRWLESSNLSQIELTAATNGLSYEDLRDDSGRWISWMSQKLPGEAGQERVRKLIGDWAVNDYSQAGTWIGTLPDGETRRSSVRAYAEALAPHEPEAAAKWALRLPEGDARDSTLKVIFNEWDKLDASASSSFKEKHPVK